MEGYFARTEAMGVRVPSSPLSRSRVGLAGAPAPRALVVEQSGTRLQPVVIPVQVRASALHVIAAAVTVSEPVHLGVESSSHDDRGEFDPLGSDLARSCPSGDRGVDMRPR